MNHHLPLCVNPETDQGVLGVLQRQSPIKAKASILHSKIDMHKLFLILRKSSYLDLTKCTQRSFL